MEKEVKIKIEIPTVPNYLLTSDKQAFSISDFSSKELQEIGELWTAELIKKAKKSSPIEK